jgi:hypothetical protein
MTQRAHDGLQTRQEGANAQKEKGRPRLKNAPY